MTWAIVASSVIGAGTSLLAADKQSNAAGQASAATMAQYKQSREDLAPWRQTGGLANSRLAYLLGLGPAGANGGTILSSPTRDQFTKTVAGGGGGYYIPRQNTGSVQDSIGNIGGTYVPGGVSSSFDQAGYDSALKAYNDQQNAPAGADYGSLLKQFTGDSLTSEPGYQFEQSEGQKAIDRAAAAAGRYDSGTTLKALTRYGNDYAGTKYNEAFNRDAATKNQTYGFLSGQSGQGANAAGMTANLGANAANAANGYLTSGADASAAGLVGASNAITSGVGSYLNYNNNQNTLAYLKGLRGGSFGTGWGGGSTAGTFGGS